MDQSLAVNKVGFNFSDVMLVQDQMLGKCFFKSVNLTGMLCQNTGNLQQM